MAHIFHYFELKLIAQRGTVDNDSFHNAQRLCFLSDGPQRLNSDIGEKIVETLGELSGS